MTATVSREAQALAPIPFGRLVRTEWRKATDTRAARWLIGLAAVAAIGFELIPLLAPDSVGQLWSNYLQFTTFGLATLLPVVSILTLTSEWTQRTVLTTFTQEPRRHRVIEAKVVVSVLMALAAVVYGLVVTVIFVGLGNGVGRDVMSDLSVGKIVGYALFILVNIGMGVAFGALLHNTAAAIVLFFVLPTAFGILSSVADWINDYLNPSTTFSWLLAADYDGHVGGILVSLALWFVLPLALGLARTARREVT